MAFFLSVLLFCYFWVSGFAMLDLFYRHNDIVRTVLVAPAVGIVTVVFANYVVSRLGFPIGIIAWPMTAILLLATIAALIWRRPLLPGGRRSVPYLALLALAFGANGWPLVTEGFSWLAGLNPDAANYMLQADRFEHQSFIEAPDPSAWLSQTDWSGYYVINSVIGVRTGTDLLLAWVSAVTGYDAPAGFMPLIVAMHVAAMGAATGLIGHGRRFARLLSGCLLAVAALSSVGVTLQLLGQELGLIGLMLASILLLSPFYKLSLPALARFTVLSSLVLASLIISYPEMLPFLGLGFLIHNVTGATELRRYWQKIILVGALIALMASALVAPDLAGLLRFLFVEGSRVTSQTGKLDELFPYFLVPTGIGALWGLRSYLPNDVSTLGETLKILIGIVLSGATLLGGLWMICRREPCAAIMTVMMLLSIVLFRGNSGFGVFKLAMYVQPFGITTAVLSLCRLLRVSR